MDGDAKPTKLSPIVEGMEIIIEEPAELPTDKDVGEEVAAVEEKAIIQAPLLLPGLQKIMPAKKSLYLATSLNKLMEKLEPVSASKLEILCKASNSLFNRAVNLSKALEIDEEMMFLLCYRYEKLLEVIKAKEKDQRFFSSRFASSLAKIHAMRLDCEKSLMERYPNEKPTAEYTKPIAILSDEVSPKLDGELSFIEPDEFYTLINTKPKDVLVIDTRPVKHFEKTCMKHGVLINIPETIIDIGLTPNSLKAKLDPAYQVIFENRFKYDYVILIDLAGKKSTFPKSKLEILKSILVDWDVESSLLNLPLILDGGLLKFGESYPTFVTDVKEIYDQKYDHLSDLATDIEYPDDEDINVQNEEDKQILSKLERLIDPSIPSPEISSATDDAGTDSRPTSASTSDPESLSSSCPSESGKSGLRSAATLQAILDVAENEVLIEDKLLELAKKRLEIKEAIIKRGSLERFVGSFLDEQYMELRTLKINFNRFRDSRVKYCSKRMMFDKCYVKLRSDDEDDLLSDMLSDINVLDKKKLLKYQARKVIEQKEEAIMPVLIEMGFNNNWEPTISLKSKKIPPVPDRRKKPQDKCVYTQIMDLRDRYPSRGLTGLSNIRNTCYMNSLIQCLRFCPTFLHDITFTDHTPRAPTLLATHTFDLMKRMWSQNLPSLRPSALLDEVRRIDHHGKYFGMGAHEDVQEFFVFATEVMHKELSVHMRIDPEIVSGRVNDWCTTFEKKQSIIARTFYFQLETSHHCKSCNISTVRYEYGNTVFINTPSNSLTIDLINQLQNYSELHGDEKKRMCLKCEKPVTSTKKVSYYPTILAVNIIRYYYSKEDNCIIRRDAQCPILETVCFGQCRYSLKSVSLHSGNKDVGHYTALCNHPFLKTWFEFNDENFKEVSPTNPKYQVQAYMLFYSLEHNPAEVNKSFMLHNIN